MTTIKFKSASKDLFVLGVAFYMAAFPGFAIAQSNGDAGNARVAQVERDMTNRSIESAKLQIDYTLWIVAILAIGGAAMAIWCLRAVSSKKNQRIHARLSAPPRRAFRKKRRMSSEAELRKKIKKIKVQQVSGVSAKAKSPAIARKSNRT